MDVSDTLSDGSPEREADAESLLCEAVKAGRNDGAIEIIENIISESKSVDDMFCASLLCAVTYSNTSMVRELLRGGANPEGNDKKDLLFEAIESVELDIAELLLEAGADVNAVDEEECSVLMVAARRGRHEMVITLFARGADVKVRSKDEKTILHHLAADKDPQRGMEAIDALLDAHVATDLQDTLGRTPLHWAVATGNVQICAKVLTLPKTRRANIQAAEMRSKTSLYIAAAWGHDGVVELLLKHGADVNARADGSWTPLHNACDAGHRGIVEKLLAAGAAVDARLLIGMTLLHIASQRGHIDVTDYLLQRKIINCHARDVFGRTPFVLALQSGNKDVIELLANTYAASDENTIGACHGFHATIIDFGNFHEYNKLRKVTIHHELLYENSSTRPRNDAIKIYPGDNNCKFRWIHLPANSNEWVDHALRKALIEEGDQDVSSFLSAERSLNKSHDGAYAHSQYMRAQSQTVEMKLASVAQFSHTSQANPGPGAGDGSETELHRSHTPIKSIVYTYMPYVHFETEDRLQEMRIAIERARNPSSQTPKRRAMTYDELLIKGLQREQSSSHTPDSGSGSAS